MGGEERALRVILSGRAAVTTRALQVILRGAGW
jgi:hypothetical protein